MAMAKISNIPKVGEFLILRTDRSEIDLQVTKVHMSSNSYGPDLHSLVTVEGFAHRERASMESPTYPNNGFGNYIGVSGNLTTQPGQTVKIMQTPAGKGMDVDITSIETVDGVKAQIVLHAGSKRVIAWESEAFEDDEDLSVKGAQTAEVKAKKAAEGHAKSVLKTLFSQS